jgi:molybdopterin converting factor small subunit
MDLAGKLGWSRRDLNIDKDKVTFKEVLSELRDLWNTIISNLDEYLILVNGVNIKLLRGLETEIYSDVTIDIFPPAGGG